MTISEIVNKAIPLSFEGVKCAVLEAQLKQKALRRREQLTKDISTLLQNNSNAGSATDLDNIRMERGAY